MYGLHLARECFEIFLLNSTEDRFVFSFCKSAYSKKLTAGTYQTLIAIYRSESNFSAFNAMAGQPTSLVFDTQSMKRIYGSRGIVIERQTRRFEQEQNDVNLHLCCSLEEKRLHKIKIKKCKIPLFSFSNLSMCLNKTTSPHSLPRRLSRI